MRVALALILGSLMAQAARADIVIGVAGPLSGQYQSFGEQMLRGAQAAVDEINGHGGISGENLRLQKGDDGCDARQAETVARQFVADGAALVIGHFCSNTALIGAGIYEAAGIPMIAPSASLPALADKAGWNVIRLASRDDAQGEAAARRIMSDLPDGAIAVIDDGSASAKALVAKFAGALGKAPALSTSFKIGEADFAGLADDVVAHKIDAAYLACSAGDAGRIAAALGVGTFKLYGPDALLADEFWAKAGAAGEGTLASFATDPQADHRAKEIVAALKAQGFNADGPTLASFAAVQLYASAAVQVGAKSGHAIADYLRSGARFETALGDLSFDKTGEVQPPRFTWYRWSNGVYRAEIRK